MPKRIWIALTILLLTITLATVVTTTRAAVDLLYFEATLETGPQVRLEWETASELDLSGFYVVRSSAPEGNYSRISNFIDGVGDSIIGATYDFIDVNINSDTNYYYKLEDIDINNVSTFHGPVVVGPATQTPTPTPSDTPPENSQPTNTPTFNPSDTPSPTPTPTISLTPTNTFTPTITPTATPPDADFTVLEAFQFPTPTLTLTSSPTLTLIPSPAPPSLVMKILPNFGIIGGVILFWTLLGIAYFKFIAPKT
ncbi:MAG: hypothetical protein MAG431_01723 [Chloroflexi bacterium]|nr:hypothetical protein [Chloroflexota bacterium]